MKLKIDLTEKTGAYLGTEINEKWWKRYTKDKMLARGNGKFWFDEDAFYFHRYLIIEPIKIYFKNIKEFKIGSWHAGKWPAGYPILKIIWLKDGLNLSSGFLVSKEKSEVEKLISKLNKFL
jgi:hypothetical protein